MAAENVEIRVKPQNSFFKRYTYIRKDLFMKVGPQRSIGVRIVCMRSCCCFEPRIASVEL